LSRFYRFDSSFADGVQDEILNNLAKIAELKVISRTSVMKYRAVTERDLRQIATVLGVANVLEGTVRRDGNHVRVSTELVDASNDHTIWADSYDRDLTDIFAIQSEIAQTVASKLSAQLSPKERKDVEEKPTDNLEAYDLYLQAKQLLDTWPLRGLEKEIDLKAISLLEQATRKDPNFVLAYCLIANANDFLYAHRLDRAPERRALGDAAVTEGLRLRPDLPEVQLAVAFHLYACNRDFERARVQIAIASQTRPNNPDLLELTAFIDRRQGRWEKATRGLERAATLDPRNQDILANLAWSYGYMRRYRDCDRMWSKVLDLSPKPQPVFLLGRASWIFAAKADVTAARAACDTFSSSMKDDPEVAFYRVYYSICARDFAGGREILSENPNKEILFVPPFPVGAGLLIPRQFFALWIEFLQGHHPTIEEFGPVREELDRKVESDRNDPFLMLALAFADIALGRNEESIEEGRRAMEMLPISEDAVEGPNIAADVALVYGWASRPNLAFEQLSKLAKIPSGLLTYGDLKTNPNWDPLRKDPRFDELLAELAPRD
jgi:TolB-like protein